VKKRKIKAKRRQRMEEADQLQAKWGTQKQEEELNDRIRGHSLKGILRRT
jgi:hypothetical protein